MNKNTIALAAGAALIVGGIILLPKDPDRTTLPEALAHGYPSHDHVHPHTPIAKVAPRTEPDPTHEARIIRAAEIVKPEVIQALVEETTPPGHLTPEQAEEVAQSWWSIRQATRETMKTIYNSSLAGNVKDPLLVARIDRLIFHLEKVDAMASDITHGPAPIAEADAMKKLMAEIQQLFIDYELQR